MGRGEMRASPRLLVALGVLYVPCIAGHLACDHGSSSAAPGPSCSILPAIACPPPNAPATRIAAAHNYAIRKLYLGDTDRTGISNSDAWKAFGYDLDGLLTTAQSTNVCTLVAGAPIVTQQDGNGGIDNSFGENIVPILETLDGTVSQSLNAPIDAGQFTIMTYAVGFDDSTGNTTTASGLTGALLAGGNYRAWHDGGPTWDLTTAWPVLSTSLDCASTGCPPGIDPITSATVQLPHAFQAEGTFVGATADPVTLSLSIGGAPLALTVHAAVVTFMPARPGAVTNGTLAGVLSAAELAASLQMVMPSLCSGDNFGSIENQLVQASDIVLGSDDETVSNAAGQPCNGISIGIGFDATEIAAPSANDVVEPPEAGCYCGCD